MDQRYHHQLFKSDVTFDSNPSKPSSSPGLSSYQFPNTSTPNIAKQNTTQEWNQVPKWKHILGEESVISPKGSDQSSSILQNNQQSPLAQLNSALNTTLSLRCKCEQISRMVASFSNKELIEIYPQLLVEVFSFSGSESFGLSKFEPRRHAYDFGAAYNFLSSGGCLFRMINKLMVDQDALFHFPYRGLPAGLAEKMKSGHISLWYQNKLIVLPGNELVLACNALEYYLLLFAYYIIHPRTLQQPAQWSGVEDVLYVRLLEDYLNYFFPVDGSKNIGAALSPERRHETSTSNSWSSPGSRVHCEVTNSPSSTLQYIHPSAHAEIFLQLLCDIWLGLNPENQADQEQAYKLPSVDHARVVRILVKYLHVFVNGNDSVQMVLFASSHPEQMEQLKSVVIPVLMYKPLYLYLQHCFTHWPLDGSFRMILETWLSFIQPWRYRENYSKHVNDTTEVVDITQWKSFIGENYLFYSSIFQMFLLRALRFDMTSLLDIQLVYRVAKVFSQASLIDILQEGSEPSLGNPINIRSPSGPMYLGLMSTSIKVQLEKPNVNLVTPTFTLEVANHVDDLCQMLASTSISMKKKCGEMRGKQKSGMLQSIKEFFLMDDTTDFDRDRERQRIIDYLDQTVSLLTTAFKLPDVQTSPTAAGGDASGDTSQSSISGATISSDDTLPEYILSENGIQLTDLGRYQIVQGIRHFPITYSGDPELQPLRTYESEVVVKALYWLACTLNNKYGQHLDKAYNQSGFVTKLLRRFSKRLHTKHYVNTPFHLPQPTLPPTEKVAPRISLRFAGSYYFLGYACWTIIIARVFGFGWLTIAFAFLLLAVVCIVAHIDQPPKKFN